MPPAPADGGTEGAPPEGGMAGGVGAVAGARGGGAEDVILCLSSLSRSNVLELGVIGL